MAESLGTIWVCQDCMLHHANGECGSCSNLYGPHDEKPLRLLPRYGVAAGMSSEEHTEAAGEEHDSGECDCETNTYSTSQCEGCGSYLHGERHAMTLFAV